MSASTNEAARSLSVSLGEMSPSAVAFPIAPKSGGGIRLGLALVWCLIATALALFISLVVPAKVSRHVTRSTAHPIAADIIGKFIISFNLLKNKE